MKNNNNENLKTISPLIFTKKVNNNHKLIPLNLTINTSGPVKHFPPATREWFNSIYAYNNNTMKNLSIADKNLSRLIKSYFNFYFTKNVLNSKRIVKRSKRIATKLKRLTMKKIFVSKAEVKHTSSKVIITLYVHNAEKTFLKRKVKKLTSIIFPSSNILYYKNLWRKKRPLHYVEKIYNLWYQYYHVPLLSWFSNNAFYYFKELMLEREKFSKLKKKNLKNKKINLLNRENLLKGLEQWIEISRISIEKHTNYYNLDLLYLDFLYWVHLSKEYKAIKYYKTLLKLNKSKFDDFFIQKLKPLVSNIYSKKEVEFNIVNLKTLYLNSDIFTQAIILKLKKRNNRLLKVLKSALFLVKLPKVNIFTERYDKTIIKELWGNRVKNLKVNLSLNSLAILRKSTNFSKDVLNNMLLEVYYNSSFIKSDNKSIISTKSSKSINKNTSLLDFLLKTLKHKNMAGVRLEIKGRLTRRFTASRSVFKIRWKGGIRNIDSSYRGLSTVMLRGHVTSNVQYSIKHSKTRNGAFGLKGWISSK